MYLLLNALWLIWMAKYILFWLYLWQLKDYHIGRFVDHFRTHKGKQLIFNFVQIFKLILLILFLVSGDALGAIFIYLFFILFLVYSEGSISFLIGIFKKSIKKPIRTLKTLFLVGIFSIIIALFLYEISKINGPFYPVLLLGFDILTPIIVSVIVLLLQPFFVMIRNNTLRKAGSKIEKVKLLSGLKVVAITGSYGKTSTKEFLSTILSKKFKVLSTKEHQNSELGIAKCILEDLKPSHQIFIAEVGAYNRGKVKEVCSILKPKIGIVTGINEQHLALFGSLENLLSAEGGRELAEFLPKDGTLVINGDNKYCLDLYKRAYAKRYLNKKIYSLSNKIVNSDIWADGIEIHEDHVSFLVVDGSRGITKTSYGTEIPNLEMAHFSVSVLGKQNIQNLLGAILIARELGMSLEEISEACKHIFQKQAGMTLKHENHGINIVDSSYSANPDGVFADLDYLSIFNGKKVIVMPCLIELGEKSSEIHEKIGRKIGKVCDLVIITSKDKFKEIEKGFNETKQEGVRCLLCDNPRDICSTITLFCKTGDTVLLEGRVPVKLISLLLE